MARNGSAPCLLERMSKMNNNPNHDYDTEDVVAREEIRIMGMNINGSLWWKSVKRSIQVNSAQMNLFRTWLHDSVGR